MVRGLGRALGWQGAQGSPVFPCDGSMAPQAPSAGWQSPSGRGPMVTFLAGVEDSTSGELGQTQHPTAGLESTASTPPLPSTALQHPPPLSSRGRHSAGEGCQDTGCSEEQSQPAQCQAESERDAVVSHSPASTPAMLWQEASKLVASGASQRAQSKAGPVGTLWHRQPAPCVLGCPHCTTSTLQCWTLCHTHCTAATLHHVHSLHCWHPAVHAPYTLGMGNAQVPRGEAIMWDQWQCQGWVTGPGGRTRLLHLLPAPCAPQLGPINPLGINDSFFHRFPLVSLTAGPKSPNPTSPCPGCSGPQVCGDTPSAEERHSCPRLAPATTHPAWPSPRWVAV